MFLHLLSRVQRRLQGSKGGERQDGVVDGTAAGGHHKAGSGRSEATVEGRKAERRRDEEGKGSGNSGGAQRWEQGSTGGGADGAEKSVERHGCICVKNGGIAPENRRKDEGDPAYR